MSDNFWGQLLKSIRQEQRLSQRSLAARTGVNRTTIRMTELGLYSPELRVMELLLGHLGYELEALEMSNASERLRRRGASEKDPKKRAQLAASRILCAQTTLIPLR